MADEHATHDLDAVASLLDGDLLPADRATAARQVARCPACAALHQELLALSAATAALPAPARTRDFRLTAADAARLAAMPPEPVASSARPVVDMRTTTDHATHDLERLSAAVDGTLPAADRPAVDAQLAACDACADLHADLLALAAANRALPTPARPRDYQLTADDARRLQRGGIRGWLDRDRVPEGPPLPPAGRGPDDARARRRAGRDRRRRCCRRPAPPRPGPPRAPPPPRRARSSSARPPTARPAPHRARPPRRASPRRHRAPPRRPPPPSTPPRSRTSRPRRRSPRRPDGSRTRAPARRAT